MKHMRMGLAVMAAGLAAACSGGGDSLESSSGYGGYGGSSSGGAPAEEGGNTQGPGTGQLTAGTWDDNLNFAFFTSWAATARQALSAAPDLDVHHRVTVTVTDVNGLPVPGAAVELDANGVATRAFTGTDGVAHVFPSGDVSPTAVKVTGHGMTRALDMTAGQSAISVVLEGALPSAGVEGMDVAFVIDATGSMGDEISYLVAEMQGLQDTVTAAFPDKDIRFALVEYRDEGDDYVTRRMDFTRDQESFRNRLGQVTAGGGGDYPEAVHSALADTAQLSWRAGGVARVAFFIADAPHHFHFAGAVSDGFKALVRKGVHLYPVISSGADNLVEYTFRVGAAFTGGRYIFLTDDSGIGGEHQEPTLPCYLVTRLDKALLRMMRIELTGTYELPAAANVIRAEGGPVDGQCTLQGGTQVHIY